MCFRCGNWDHTLHSCPTLQLNPFRDEKNKQEYGVWLSVDGKFHEEYKLLLTIKLDEFGQISYINYINASSLEKPLSHRPFHYAMVRYDGKRRAGSSRSALLPPRNPTSVELCQVPTAAKNWSKRTVQGTKRKLESGEHEAQGNGLSGGLALFWYDDLVNVHILSSIGHVDAKITPTYSMPMRQFTGFYGHPTYDARAHTCTLLCQLGILHTLPWLCRGDFNEILSHEKKWT
ncbi:hypothetical protein M9H77_12384 [Catharanthus roseus]|uniref:Uncharacterized protein n=1 Tax=Catharanthus roseus TaxID=4058 RepID=A0ACC0BH80_CATRO|nr:hypothetical protein M9H77_12384 [Catharanthus roseus]